MKLWKVSTEFEALVMAESEEEAREIAEEKRWLQNEVSACCDDFDIRQQKDRMLPLGWEPDQEIYHAGDGAITIEQAFDTVLGKAQP